MKQWLEKAVNRYLALDPESKQRMIPLQNKIVTFEIKGISLTVQMIFIEKMIQLKWDQFQKPDLIIRGTPLNLFHMHMARDQRQSFFAEDVMVEGNMELAQHVLALFDELEIDWEDYFSTWFGDIPAHQVGRLMRDAKKMGQRICNTFSYNTSEYIHEEANMFPPKEALQQFFQEVDELRMDVDRLNARIEKLRAKW